MPEKKIETRGRPRVNSTSINLRLEPDLLKWVDEQRAKRDPVPSRPEMIRIYLDQRRSSS